MTLRRAVAVVLALRSDDLGHLELHQLVHDAQADPDAERQQALARRADELAERFLNLRRQRRSSRPWRRPSPLPAQIQEALGELVGGAREGLLALSVGVGLGVVHELMELEVTEVVGPKGSTTATGSPSVTAMRTAR